MGTRTPQRVPPSEQFYRALIGLRVGAIVGTLLGAAAAALIGSAMLLLIVAGGAFGGAAGYRWERGR